MSAENVRAFLDRVAQDASLQQEFEATLRSDVVNGRARIAAFAQSLGYSFSEAELARAMTTYAGEPISMESLDLVAGGFLDKWWNSFVEAIREHPHHPVP